MLLEVLWSLLIIKVNVEVHWYTVGRFFPLGPPPFPMYLRHILVCQYDSALLAVILCSCIHRHVAPIREALEHYELALAIDADFTLAEFNSGLTYQVVVKGVRETGLAS